MTALGLPPVVRPAAVERFFAEALAVAGRAAAAHGRIGRRYRLGPGAFRLVAAGAEAAAIFEATFSHIRLPDAGEAELEIHAWSEEAGPLPPAPWPALQAPGFQPMTSSVPFATAAPRSST